MSKPNSSDLFKLIKSMNASEKRYFKVKTLNNKEDTKFFALFNLINNTKEFDKEKGLEKASFITAHQLPNLKSNLYKKILQSLRSYHLPTTTEAQISEMIDYVHLLFNRSQYKQCANQLNKAKTLAKKSNNAEMLLVILKWQKNVVLQTATGGSKKLVKEIISEAREVNQIINNINQFTNIQLELNALYQKIGFIRNKEDYALVAHIFKSSMPVLDEDSLSTNEKFSLYSLYINYYFFIQAFRKGYSYCKRWVALYDNPIIIRTEFESYIQALNSLMIAQTRLGLYAEFYKSKRTFRKIHLTPKVVFTRNINRKLFKYNYVHEFNGLFMQGHFLEGVRMFERIKPNLGNYYSQLDAHSRIIMFYKIACLYVGNENFEESLSWLNLVINSENEDLREDVHGFARILSLICHYEMGDQDVIDYYIRSTYRFLFKKKNFQRYQSYILSFLRKSSSQFSTVELTNHFKLLRTQLLPLESNPYEKRAFLYFDIISWLESKIYNKPVQDIIRKKAKKNNIY